MHKQKAAIALSLNDSAAHSLASSPDEPLLASGSYQKIKVWGLEANQRRNKPAGELVDTLTGHLHTLVL